MKVLAAGVSLPDVLAREGVHPETPRVPYTPGWDLVGLVDRLGSDQNFADRLLSKANVAVVPGTEVPPSKA